MSSKSVKIKLSIKNFDPSIVDFNEQYFLSQIKSIGLSLSFLGGGDPSSNSYFIEKQTDEFDITSRLNIFDKIPELNLLNTIYGIDKETHQQFAELTLEFLDSSDNTSYLPPDNSTISDNPTIISF